MTKVEVGVKESSKKKLVRSTWAAHVKNNWQRADAQKVDGKWRRGRPRLTSKGWEKNGKNDRENDWRLLRENVIRKNQKKKK